MCLEWKTVYRENYWVNIIIFQICISNIPLPSKILDINHTNKDLRKNMLRKYDIIIERLYFILKPNDLGSEKFHYLVGSNYYREEVSARNLWNYLILYENLSNKTIFNVYSNSLQYLDFHHWLLFPLQWVIIWFLCHHSNYYFF